MLNALSCQYRSFTLKASINIYGSNEMLLVCSSAPQCHEPILPRCMECQRGLATRKVYLSVRLYVHPSDSLTNV